MLLERFDVRYPDFNQGVGGRGWFLLYSRFKSFFFSIKDYSLNQEYLKIDFKSVDGYEFKD